MDNSHLLRAKRLSASVLSALFVLGAAACSTDETVYDDDPIGTADVTVGNVGVEDGSEGGLDLDNGNVPGSSSDAELDPADEVLEINPVETDE